MIAITSPFGESGLHQVSKCLYRLRVEDVPKMQTTVTVLMMNWAMGSQRHLHETRQNGGDANNDE